jgi:succinate dehydrogenase / fumarate reductase cytochrome b subunit
MTNSQKARPFIFTTIGRKYLMGLSGLVWVGFVFAHMAGNLLMFISSDAYNKYGYLLTSGYVIYAAEAVLIAALLTHVICAISLVLDNRKARGDHGYESRGTSTKKPSFASNWMAQQGTIILIFIITHLFTFKYGEKYETTVDGIVMRDLFRLVVEVFQQPAYVVGYLVCLALLGFHLSHGVRSIFQSFGLLTPQYQSLFTKIGYFYAIIVTAGFISQPLYVYLIH